MTKSYNIDWWWDNPPKLRLKERDRIILWWKTHYWLALNGWLQTSIINSPSVKPIIESTIEKDNQLGFRSKPEHFKNRQTRIMEALMQANGIQKDAGEILGLSPRQMIYYVKKFDLYHLCTISKFRRKAKAERVA